MALVATTTDNAPLEQIFFMIYGYGPTVAQVTTYNNGAYELQQVSLGFDASVVC